jgi:hypothetical protein
VNELSEVTMFSYIRFVVFHYLKKPLLRNPAEDDVKFGRPLQCHGLCC